MQVSHSDCSAAMVVQGSCKGAHAASAVPNFIFSEIKLVM